MPCGLISHVALMLPATSAKNSLHCLQSTFPLEVGYKIFNKQNVKLSYSCLPNMKSIIAVHNEKILNQSTSERSEPLPCNCRNKSTCPLNGKCREKSLIYKASIITPDNKTMSYYGCCEMDFKARYYNHT